VDKIQKTELIMTQEISHAKNNIDSYLISITSAWNKAAMSIIEVGRQLNEAKENLSNIKFRQLKRELEDQRIMSNSTITKLRMIANNVVLTKEENQKYLPPSYETLYLLSRVEENELSEAFDNQLISTETQRNNIPNIFGYQKITSSKANSNSKISISIPENLSRDEMVQLKIYLSEIKKISGVKINNPFDD